MPFVVIRLCLFALVSLAFTGCDRLALKKRAEAIRERNAKLDRISEFRVLHEVRKHWAIRGDAWFGKMGDGSLLRLDSPVVHVAPVKVGKPFCCNWLGEATIAASRWRSHPPSGSGEPFTMRYQAIMECADRYLLTTLEGREASPPTDSEIGDFEASTIHAGKR